VLDVLKRLSRPPAGSTDQMDLDRMSANAWRGASAA